MPTPKTPCRARRSAATVPHRPRPARRQRPPAPAGGAGDRHERNRRRLAAYAASADPHRRLALRNAVVADNLALVVSVVGRMSRCCELPFDDLFQVGSLGLIRAVEAFDPRRSASLSTFAVPYIRGAIQHEIRDRQPLMRIPRQLWELRLQVSRLQEGRARQGLAPLGDAGLSGVLGCAEEVVRQTLALSGVTRMLSLDAPPPRRAGDAAGMEVRLIDQLGEISPPEPAAREKSPAPDGPQWDWLKRQLQELDPLARQLLMDHFEPGCTWVELGRRHGLPPRQAQRRHVAAFDRLRRMVPSGLQPAQKGAARPSASPRAMASAAPMKV